MRSLRDIFRAWRPAGRGMRRLRALVPSTRIAQGRTTERIADSVEPSGGVTANAAGSFGPETERWKQELGEAQLTKHVKPTIDAERCVHGRSPIAQCRACVTACPVFALALEDEGLTFDEDLCDGCALCAPACPEQAIDLGLVARPFIGPPAGADSAFAACERVVPRGEPGAVTCLHAMSATQLARLHAGGIGTLVVAAAACEACRRHYGTTLAERVSHMTRLTSDRGLAPLKLRSVDTATWREERDDAGRVTRRSLFRGALRGRSASRPSGGETPATAGNPDTTAPAAVLGARDRATIATFSPSIDQATCDACGVCVEVCAQGALRFLPRIGDDARGSRYEIDATRCTGCALCVDSCQPGAISLVAWGLAHPPPIPLVAGKCRMCSSPFHAVAQTAPDTSLCRICATKTHHQKLFQVLS